MYVRGSDAEGLLVAGLVSNGAHVGLLAHTDAVVLVRQMPPILSKVEGLSKKSKKLKELELLNV